MTNITGMIDTGRFAARWPELEGLTTPWFRGSDRPARPGRYQRIKGLVMCPAVWDGIEWKDFDGWGTIRVGDQDLPWRGLAEEPPADMVVAARALMSFSPKKPVFADELVKAVG